MAAAGDRPTLRPGGARSPVLARNGMVATSQPLASVAALRVLEEGGNAVDAAITAAAVLGVVEPMMTGIGGDMFALVHMSEDGRPVGLNGSGWAGSRASLDGSPTRPGPGPRALEGIRAVTVPGAVAGWFKLHDRYGRLPASRLLAPAIEYAEEGFPVSEIVAGDWARSDPPETYRVGPRAPRAGDVFRNPRLGRSLRLLAEGGPDVFYRGEIGEKIVGTSERLGGFLTPEDLERFEARWVEPLSTTYRGYTVLELGPNTQGLAVLQMLNVLEGFDLGSMEHNSADYLHLLIEAKRLAFADRAAFIADPACAGVPIEGLLSKKYAAGRRGLIDPDRARSHLPAGDPEWSDTVYLAVVDQDRNAVSFINSLFSHFGCGIEAGDTGIVLHDRGSGFSPEPGHPNALAPRNRPLHTLIPALVLSGGAPYFCFGVMGGDMQAQGHVQVLANLIDFGMDPQHAGEAPRFRHIDGAGVALESAIGGEVRRLLENKGHTPIQAEGVFGGYQGIRIDPASGVLEGGSDHRKDGLALGW